MSPQDCRRSVGRMCFVVIAALGCTRMNTYDLDFSSLEGFEPTGRVRIVEHETPAFLFSRETRELRRIQFFGRRGRMVQADYIPSRDLDRLRTTYGPADDDARQVLGTMIRRGMPGLFVVEPDPPRSPGWQRYRELKQRLAASDYDAIDGLELARLTAEFAEPRELLADLAPDRRLRAGRDADGNWLLRVESGDGAVLHHFAPIPVEATRESAVVDALAEER